jgi:hypothetical protein
MELYLSFKVGDRFVDIYVLTHSPRSARGTIIAAHTEWYQVKFDDGGGYSRSLDDEDLIPEEIFDSPLYKALKEEDEIV